MNASHELDAELRAMLRTRARDITTVPADVLPAKELEPPTRSTRTAVAHRIAPRQQPVLIAAAVVAVLAVSGGVTALALHHDGTGRRAPAGYSSLSASRTDPTPAPTVHSTPFPNPTTCSTSLPPAWKAKLIAPGTGTDRDTTLGTSTDGSVLYSRDLGNGREVRLGKPDGTSNTVLTLPDSDKLAPQFAVFSGNDAVIGLIYAPRGGNGTGDALFRIDVVDLTTGAIKPSLDIMTMADYVDGDRTTEGMAVANGVIYWDERPTYDSKTGVVRSYDIASGKRGVAYRGPAVTVHQSAGEVYATSRSNQDATPVTIGTTDLPTPVQQATTAISRTTLATDGTHYVWQSNAPNGIGYYDGTTVQHWSVSVPTVSNGSLEATLAVAGGYIAYYDRKAMKSMLLDTRTGAQAPFPDSVFLTGGGGSYLTGYYSDGKTSSRVLQVDTSALPDLRC